MAEAGPSLYEQAGGRSRGAAVGGPQRYTEEYGHPGLRQRHMPFSIDQSARVTNGWSVCAKRKSTGIVSGQIAGG